MSSSSSISLKPPQTNPLHVDTTNAPSSSRSSPSPRPSAASASAGGGGANGQNQACAACKYQRRKCNPDCPLARYFPADQRRRFLHAHRLFGVSNIQKTLKRIDPEYGPEAMRALIYQAEARAVDPVYGCVGIIKRLEHEFNAGTAELRALKQQIAMYRQQAAVAAAGGDPMLVADPAILAAAVGQGNGVAMAMDALYGAGEQEAGAGFVVVHDQQQQADYNAAAGLKVDDEQDQPPAIPLYDYFCYDGAPVGGDEATSQDATVHNGYTYSDAASVKQQHTARSLSMSTLGHQMEQHCQIEASPFAGAFDVKPHDLPGTLVEQHHGLGGDDGIQQPEHKVVAVAKCEDDADQKMAAPAQCHLELGFSAF